MLNFAVILALDREPRAPRVLDKTRDIRLWIDSKENQTLSEDSRVAGTRGILSLLTRRSPFGSAWSSTFRASSYSRCFIVRIQIYSPYILLQVQRSAVSN